MSDTLEEKTFHDLNWTVRGDEPCLKLLTPDGVDYHPFEVDPYCYIREDDISAEVLQTIKEIDETAALYKVDDYHQGKLRKIEMTLPKQISTLRDELEDIETLQSDIPFARRVLIDQDVGVTPTDDVLVFDIEVDSSDGFPDVEAADDRILTICGMDTSGNEYTWAYDDEERTIEEFFETAYEYKTIMGWNSLTFDKPYLENRADRLGIYYDSFKYVHIDAMAVYRDILLIGQSSYKLENVVDDEFDHDYYQFDDVDYDQLGEYFWNNRDRLVEYNLEDVQAVLDLENRYQFKDLVYDILAGDGYCRPEDIFYVQDEGGYKKIKKSATVLVEGIIINESTVRSPDTPIIWPNKYQGMDEDRFQGADVLEPDPGLHSDVIVLDFSSMYPAIIEALNVGPETWREDPDEGDIKAPIGSFVSEPESKFSRAYRRAQNPRNEWKQKKKERTRGSPNWYVALAFDTGLKARTNTFYGVIGSRYSRFYNKNVAENITRMGARMIRKTQELAEEEGYSVIYGDTDSVIIELEDVDDPVEEGKEMGQRFSEAMKHWIADEYNGDPDLIQLTLDEVYESFFITEAKKRYAGYCVWAGSPCFTFEMTGFESVRGDTMDAIQSLQEELLKRILREEDAFDVVDDYKDRLYGGELDEQLVTIVGISKPISEYGSEPPHVRVAKRRDMNVGDEIPYLKYGNDPEDVVYAGDEEYKNYLTQAAYDYIWERKFQPIIDRLGLERHEETTLGDFA